MAYLGIPDIAALGTGFKHHTNIRPISNGRRYKYRSFREHPNRGIVNMAIALSYADIAEQILHDDAPLDWDTDPRKASDEFASAEQTLIEQLLRDVLQRPEWWGSEESVGKQTPKSDE
jgi:hypothetical protein